MTLSIILLVLAGITKAFMDLSSESNLPFKGSYFSKGISWKNKWKLKDSKLILAIKGDNWWYLGIIKPKYKEKFPFSSTILVSLTDFWHLSQSLFLKFLVLGVYLFQPIYNPQVDFIIVFCSILIPFELAHSSFKNKRK